MSNVVYYAEPARVVPGKNGAGFRILWTQNGRQRERTATDLNTAKVKALDVSRRLSVADSAEKRIPANPQMARFEDLLGKVLEEGKRHWSPEWANRVKNLAGHVLRGAGPQVEYCHQLTPEILRDLLGSLLLVEETDEGITKTVPNYSVEFVGKVRRLLISTIQRGIELGVWPSNTPLLGALKKVKLTKARGGAPDKQQIPTDEQVADLVKSMTNDKRIYGTMAVVAAFTGVRWGELLAIRESSLDLENKTLRVDLTCVEQDDGLFRFQAPSKSTASIRTVPLESNVVAALEAFLEDFTPQTRPGPHVDGEKPPLDLLFLTPSTGNPFRRAHFGTVFRRHRLRLESGWPCVTDNRTGHVKYAPWHYLRHYCGTRWVNLGVEITAVSRALGHSQVSTTMNWYMGTDKESMERMAAVLSRTDTSAE